MSDQSFFQNALSNFTHEAASGGAIRHLTDLGYTVKQISEQLSFPTPIDRVRRQVWERLKDTKIILTEEPGSGSSSVKKADYVREYDQYGKASFRRVTETTEEATITKWKEIKIDCADREKFRSFLEKKINENGQDHSYAACEFGILIKRDPQRYQALLAALDKGQREYMEGLPWEAKRIYHRLDSRMFGILLRLLAAGLWQGDCYFLKTGERITM